MAGRARHRFHKAGGGSHHPHHYHRHLHIGLIALGFYVLRRLLGGHVDRYYQQPPPDPNPYKTQDLLQRSTDRYFSALAKHGQWRSSQEELSRQRENLGG